MSTQIALNGHDMGEVVRQRRQQVGLWVHQLAGQVDINPGRISELETGKRTWESLKKVHRDRIVEVLGLKS